MIQNSSSNFAIRQFAPNDANRVIFIWEQCYLARNWNNLNFDTQCKLNFQNELFFFGLLNNTIIATAMFGYDGHKGWLNYFAVLPNFQKRGFGNQLMTFGEMALIEKGCLKINPQIRAGNKELINFYKAVGYSKDEVIGFGKRLIEDGAFYLQGS